MVGTGELRACTQAGAATAAFNSIQQAADAAKIPFSSLGLVLPISIPLDAKQVAAHVLVLLLEHLWRKKGPEMGVRKAFGESQG